MASQDTMQDCRRVLDELKELCAIANEPYRAVFMQMADNFDLAFQGIEEHPNNWKVGEENVKALHADILLLIERVKLVNKLHP